MKKLDTSSKQPVLSLFRKNTGLLCLVTMLLNLSGAWAQCDNTPVLSISGPFTTTWTAPSTGGPFLIRISATGGAGGAYLEGLDRTGGTGATMSGTFIVQNGEVLRAIAGSGGNHSQLEGGGGGGGSGAVNCGNPSDCANGVILIIAAGGNGGQLGGANGGFGLGGSNSTGGGGDGGQIIDNDSGGGGGGLNSGGESAISGGDGGGQVSKIGLSPGGEGSSNMMSIPPSGFNHGGPGMGGGGGGGDGATSDNASGGGGGHTGANGGNEIAASSFNSGDDPTDSPGIDGGGSSGPPSIPSTPGTVSFICLVALPIKLTNFKAVIQHTSVQLHWSTAVEINNHGYEVERSADGHHWSALGFVPGSGNTAIRRDYSFTDESPYKGINYYRLKQLDTDGKHEYSPMVVADVRSNGQQFDIFPNPSTTGELSVRMVSDTEGAALLEIFDWTGHKVWKETLSLMKGTIVWPFSMSTFPKGAYTARLKMPDGEVRFKKILLE